MTYMTTRSDQALKQAAMQVESFGLILSSSTSELPWPNFQTPKTEPEPRHRPFAMRLSNEDRKSTMYDVLKRPVEYILEGVRPPVGVASQRPTALSFEPSVLKISLDKAWIDLKGVTAIMIASI